MQGFRLAEARMAWNVLTRACARFYTPNSGKFLNFHSEGVFMAKGPLNDQQVRDYHANGYVLAKGLFDAEEVGLLQRAAKEDRELDQHSFGRKDGEGGITRLSLWNHPGDTLYGMFARWSPWSTPRKSFWAARCTTTIPR